MSRERLACFDWDGTLRPGASMRKWTQYLESVHALKPGVYDDSERGYEAYLAGELTHDALVQVTVDLYAYGLEGREAALVRAHGEQFVAEDSKDVVPFAAHLLHGLRSDGVVTAIVSGSPTEILYPHAARLGIDAVFCTELEVVDGIYTGAVVNNGGIASAKQRVADGLGDRYEIVLALGDSLSDLPLLRAARVAVVVGAPELDVDGLRIPLDALDAAEILTAVRALAPVE
jgi:HAD superfamily phosphoserine phosphatase-like hydrolase